MKDLSPVGWALRPLKRYAEFSGRSSRAEFWWFFLAMIVIYTVMWFVLFGVAFSSIATRQTSPSAGLVGVIGIGGMLLGVFWLALLIPTIAVQARRLHDINRSGWWLGAFYLLYVVYFALMLSGLGSMMSATAAGNAPPPTPTSPLFMGVMVLAIVIFVYAIALLVFYCLPGTTGANRFGDDPYGADVREVFA